MTILLALILITLIFGGDFVLSCIIVILKLSLCLVALGSLGMFAYALVNMI